MNIVELLHLEIDQEYPLVEFEYLRNQSLFFISKMDFVEIFDSLYQGCHPFSLYGKIW